MKRCAIYARYSSDLQSPTSIDDQVHLCRAYADRQGWVIITTFHDAALSGFGVEQRPGYQQLVAAAGATPSGFDTILVEDLSRLTRDTGELLRLYHRLRLKSIDIVGVSDGIASGQRGGKVQLTVKGLVNELYLDDLRDKTHRGLAGCAARGLSAGGRIFGYRTVPVEAARRGAKHTAPARFEINAVEATIVQRIFRDYAAGQSMQAIAFALNRDGVHFPAQETQRGPHRRGWAVSAVRVILRNEKYAGGWVWNKRRFIKDPDTGRRRALPRPPPRSGFARSMQSSELSTLPCGRPCENGWHSSRRPTPSVQVSPRAAGRMWPTRLPPLRCVALWLLRGTDGGPDDHAEKGDRRLPVRGLPVRIRQDEGAGGLYAREGVPPGAA